MSHLNQTNNGTGRRYAFVLPRFGEGIVGGAETLVGTLARKLKLRGDQVQVFSTCARDNRTWVNEYPAGSAREYGVAVERFPVSERDIDRWIPRQISISQGMQLGVSDQMEWMENSVVSKELLDCLEAKSNDFDAFFFAPYLFGTTFWGALVNPGKSILIPCLHNESYAYLSVISSMFRQVKGALFNSEPEGDLARSLYGSIKGGEVGMGFEPVVPAALARLKPYFEERFPYIFYTGRKETGKNVQLLVDYFVDLKSRELLPDLKLVIAGGGSSEDLERPLEFKRPDIIDLPHVSEEEKKRLMRHALVLCQPSVNESFSIVLMEAWLVGTPVLVHAHCNVTRHHAVESGGGLYFANSDDFALCLKELAQSAGLRTAMARAGQRYVLEKYNWEAVLKRFDKVMQELL